MEQLERYFLWLVLYSAAGWAYESVLCSLQEKRLINRGFLNGPYCIIYGVGAVSVIRLLSQAGAVSLFFLSILLAGLIEYGTSWAMEKLFHARWWDYTDQKFNLNGRICLLGLLIFGVFSLTLIQIVQPAVAACTDQMDEGILRILDLSLLAVLLGDIVVTVRKFSEFDTVLQETSELLDDAVKSMRGLYVRASFSCRYRFYHINSQIRRMITVFPRLRSTHNNEVLQKLRELLIRETEEEKAEKAGATDLPEMTKSGSR